jgi:transcriptional regulator with XRE-family HTH domain
MKALSIDRKDRWNPPIPLWSFRKMKAPPADYKGEPSSPEGKKGLDATHMKKAPNPIDHHVGSRVRMRRVLLGMSQEKLGEALGLTFQQVQKYEKGTNRIGASRLQQISKALGVPPSFFFDGLPTGDTHPTGFSESGSSHVVKFLSTTEGIQLNKAFARIRDPRVRKRIIDLVVSLAGEEEESESGQAPFDL